MGFFGRLFKKRDIRQDALLWWDKLTTEEREKIESDYYDESCTGESTDIDIEVMYQIYSL